MIYKGYQAHADLLGPARWLALATLPVLGYAPTRLAAGLPGRTLSAMCEVFGLLRLTHRRPEFGIESVRIDDREVTVTEECTHRSPFGTLLHFRKGGGEARPPVLIIAPMSGHFATLLRDTVQTMPVEHDVWITDWHNARDVPRVAGPFGLEEYIDHLLDWLRVLGPGVHVVAICQPCVPALAAAALLAQDGDPAVPRSLTLMAGPIDCRVNPTEVNRLATSRPIQRFEDHLIDSVPLRYAGAMRAVYPGSCRSRLSCT